MPIANCVVSPLVIVNSSDSNGIIKKWGEYSGVECSEMTVTMVRGEEQAGKKYDAICTLHLPDLWPAESVSLLQIGLAKAISEHYGLKATEVLVMTSLVESGYVVEGGKQINWGGE